MRRVLTQQFRPATATVFSRPRVTRGLGSAWSRVATLSALALLGAFSGCESSGGPKSLGKVADLPDVGCAEIEPVLTEGGGPIDNNASDYGEPGARTGCSFSWDGTLGGVAVEIDVIDGSGHSILWAVGDMKEQIPLGDEAHLDSDPLGFGLTARKGTYEINVRPTQPVGATNPGADQGLILQLGEGVLGLLP